MGKTNSVKKYNCQAKDNCAEGDVWLSGIGVTTQPQNLGFEPQFLNKCLANPAVPAALSKVVAVVCCCSNGWSLWIFPCQGDPSWLLQSTDFVCVLKPRIAMPLLETQLRVQLCLMF
jgi:hypothetical protein